MRRYAMVRRVRSRSKFMGLSTMRNAAVAVCHAHKSGAVRQIAAMMVIAVIASFIGCRRQPEKSAELWLGGDVNLGDGGKEQLKAISAMVAGAIGIVNLEGPVTQRLPQDKLRLWN